MITEKTANEMEGVPTGSSKNEKREFKIIGVPGHLVSEETLKALINLIECLDKEGLKFRVEDWWLPTVKQEEG